ncbi:PqqD family peptide modification chaperone [Halomonas sp. H10-9-1]|uniref:PqqD family peptide modification chaperone n=1 Tax=Halomonas sp. H10-9-1 TaxID=2950871 RepID=UPI0032E017E5
MTEAWDIALPGLGRLLRVQEAPEVVEALGQALPGWPLAIARARGLAPAIRLRRSRGGYLQRSPQLPRGLELPTPASAVCSLIADLGGERFERATGLLGLHCASVEVGGRLVLFPESHRAGKSTLAVAFAVAGYRLFGDDVLGLTREGCGVALGIAPRLRLPLPETLAPELADYAEVHAGPEDARYRFVLPPGNALARHGEQGPVGALVLLERDDQRRAPEVVRLLPGEGLLQLLAQNFAHHAAPETLMAHLLPLMERVPCLLLRYAEPLAAARHLGAVLEAVEGEVGGNEDGGNAKSKAGHDGIGAVCHAGALARRDAVPVNGPFPATRRWMAAREVRGYPLGHELFLIQPASGVIHRLNPTGEAVWRLLCQEPLTGRELGELLGEHFDEPLASVTEDVCRLLAGLADAGLLTAAE